jgi:hypothetical protein
MSNLPVIIPKKDKPRKYKKRPIIKPENKGFIVTDIYQIVAIANLKKSVIYNNSIIPAQCVLNMSIQSVMNTISYKRIIQYIKL